MRSETSSAGAQIPIAAKVGSNPTSAVATPIVSSETTNSDLRPMRSPRWPAIAPPMGRASTPTASVVYEAMMLAKAECEGKYCELKTSAAAVP